MNLDIARQREIGRLKKISYELDEKFTFPGTNIRFGWDFIVGLIPGFGDLVTTILSLYLVLRAFMLKSSWPLLFRMLVNVGVEAVLGVFPFVGDFFDLFWRANKRNMALLEREWNEPRKSKARNVAFLFVFFFSTLFIFGGTLYLIVQLFSWLWMQISQISS